MMRQYSSLVLVLLFVCYISFSEALTGFSVELIHRDSPKSPYYRPNQTQFERVMDAVNRSMIRANYFRKSSVSLQDIAETNVVTINGEYLMGYKVGTPPFEIFGEIDTGSSLIWMQCQPCESCYKETRPVFDPSTSATYDHLSCYSLECKLEPFTFCKPEIGDKCLYNTVYEDGSRSSGELIMETLIIGYTDPPFRFPGIVFGCGNKNSGFFHAQASGVVGLGTGPSSLINQLPDKIDKKFSYCFPPMFSRSSYSSKINFGDVAVVSGGGTVSTPIIPKGQETFYYLHLEAISVGNKRIEYVSREFANIIIDSGTTITFLPKEFYSRVVSAVAAAIPNKPMKIPQKPYTLCYASQFGKLTVPVITAHFKDADVKLYAISTFSTMAPGISCFSFLPGETPIFGNLAQQNLMVGYDVHQRKVNFKPTDCTKQ
ncbi:unnamed protein product [Sphenostylis stenocarpa]|uniref:Peptidase A1 domain-containing protein n=1 Tax=Sphenostylis stenocarpa TaxID=92480 RepID=A0AA86W562_9FABA|nr:unnamed protein product [Sphenostylis stenocarpa]